MNGLFFCELIDFSEINFGDPIFDSIRIDYPDYEEWKVFALKSVNEKCALAVKTHSGFYAGIAILMNGTAPTEHSRSEIRISIFKVLQEAEYQGVADVLISQLFVKAIEDAVDVIFITVPHWQADVARYLEFRGFRRIEMLTKNQGRDKSTANQSTAS